MRGGRAEAKDGDWGSNLVSARNLEIHGQWGKVFGPLNLEIEGGGVTVINAPPGAARTALMMALCGRMKISRGTLTVMGHENDQRAVFVRSAIACFDELDGIQPSVTVQDLITEQIRWESHWYSWVPRANTSRLKEMCGYLFEDLPLPPIDAFIADLPELHQMLLRIGVANTRRPELLIVGRLDHMAEDGQRHALMERLERLGREQSVITADVNTDDYEVEINETVEVPGLLEFQQRSSVAKEMLERSWRWRAGDPEEDSETVRDEERS